MTPVAYSLLDDLKNSRPLKRLRLRRVQSPPTGNEGGEADRAAQ
jgi:hypothetical protein